MARESRGSEQTFAAVAARFLRDVMRPDLGRMADDPAVRELLHAQWEAATKAGRTGEAEREYREYALEQIGAAWVLSALFLRVLEDRGMVDVRRVAGGGATDEEELFRELFPNLGPREYLLTAFKEVAQWPGGAEILGPAVNPAWRLYPSQEAARGLLDLFREADAQGALRFTFEGSDTRFLGDLYEQISAGIRARFALLQTPDFVEEFILARTLDPALSAFGLDGLRVIDPTCGSGHFLLGAFHRLLAEERRGRPDLDPKEHVVRALGHVHGSDINPYAVAIARLRLALAAAEACGVARMEDLPRDDGGNSRLAMLRTNVVVADSLVAGAQGQLDLAAARQSREAQLSWGTPGFDLEDPEAVRALFAEGFHAVVGNPPYIASDDEALRKKYRELYPKSAKGKYTLSAPFTERFFTLATKERGGGFVGLINSNAFLKREFGKGLIEQVLPGVDLTKVVDTSGAYIPGHGTPTVILFGRNRAPQDEAVTVVMGRRGEPETPEDPAKGKVWSSIAAHDGEVGYEDEFITVAEMKRAVLAKHPWSLSGGGASGLKEKIEAACGKKLGDVAESIGITAFTLEDDAFLNEAGALRRFSIEEKHIRTMVVGEVIRDWSMGQSFDAVFPYEEDLSPCNDLTSHALRFLWPCRTSIANNILFGGKTKTQGGLQWFEYGRLTKDKFTTPLTITFAFVATHNHFVLAHEGKVFNRSAPVIKLPASATENDHLGIVSWLNSSAACFWMKQVCQPKGATSANHNHPDPARFAYEFGATALGALPVSTELAEFGLLGDELDRISRKRADILSTDQVARVVGDRPVEAVREFLTNRWEAADQLRERMIFIQEEIDWTVYICCGIAPEDCRVPPVLRGDTSVLLPRGKRAFERVLGHLSLIRSDGRLLNVEEAEVASSTAVDARLEAIIQRRVHAIRNTPMLQLIETNVFKRLWRDTEENIAEPEYRARENRRQVTEILLEAIERFVATTDAPITTDAIHHAMLIDPIGRALLALLADDDGRQLIRDLLASDSVPYLAAMRHTDAGLSKRADWERTWALQRREDAGEVIGDIPVPPKYGREDYRDPRYWSLRGKLDVPRERFIAYPGAETDPRAPLFGWAGWDHLQRARALATLYTDRKNADAWDRDRLRPLLAGIAELVPWLLQWHDAPDPELDGQGHGRLWKEFVENERHALRWTEEELRGWRPATKAEQKAAKKAAKGKA